MKGTRGAWSDARAHFFNPARSPVQTAELRASVEWLNDYFARAIEARRGRRGADLISELVAADTCALFLLDEESEELVVRSAVEILLGHLDQ